MKIKYLLIILAISLLLIGCGEKKKDDTKGAYLGGTSGLTAEFEAFGVEEDGLYTIFDEETFPIEVTLRNKGEFETKPGEVSVKLLGPSPDEFKGIPAWELKNKGTLQGISELIPDGDEETITFTADAEYKLPVTGVLDRTWFANIEYHYKTFVVVPQVCLKEDLKDKRVWEVKEDKTFFVSGAPITITKVEESTAGKGIMALKFQVSNVGSGKVTKPADDFGVRNTFSLSIDDPAWECKSAGKVNEGRLTEGAAEIVCKLKTALKEGTLSTKQIKLTLDYKYRDIIQENLRIKQSAE